MNNTVRITQIELDEKLRLHNKWINNDEGERLNLNYADLRKRNLSSMNLSSSNLCSTNFSGSNLCLTNLFNAVLCGANLFGVDLSGANLCGAHLYSNANLSRTNLSNANLSNANLSGANLSNAKLLNANLSNVNLTNANLSHARLLCANISKTRLPSLSRVLLCEWGSLSEELTQKAMAYDASFHENPKAFDEWVETGVCPYYDVRYERACNFIEEPDLWDPKIPCPRGFDLMVEIIREKCTDSDYHKK